MIIAIAITVIVTIIQTYCVLHTAFLHTSYIHMCYIVALTITVTITITVTVMVLRVLILYSKMLLFPTLEARAKLIFKRYSVFVVIQ